MFRLVSLSSGALRSFIQYQLQDGSVFLQRGPAVSSWSRGDAPWTYFSMVSMLHLLLWTRCVSSLWQLQNLYFLAASFKNLQAALLAAFPSSEEQGKNMRAAHKVTLELIETPAHVLQQRHEGRIVMCSERAVSQCVRAHGIFPLSYHVDSMTKKCHSAFKY